MTIEKEADLVMELLQACKNNEIDKVKYYLTSPLLETKPHINDTREMYKNNFYTSLMLAVEANNIPLVEYLLLSSDLTEHANINSICCYSDPREGSCALSIAALQGLEYLVDFLLHSPHLTEHAKVCPTLTTLEFVLVNGKHEFKEKEHVCYSPLINALSSNNITILNMILSQPELKNNEQLVYDIIHDTLGYLFSEKKLEMITHLLLNDYIHISPELDEYIEGITDRHFHVSIIKLTNSIALKNNLHEDLENKSTIFQKLKI